MRILSFYEFQLTIIIVAFHKTGYCNSVFLWAVKLSDS